MKVGRPLGGKGKARNDRFVYNGKPCRSCGSEFRYMKTNRCRDCTAKNSNNSISRIKALSAAKNNAKAKIRRDIEEKELDYYDSLMD